MRDEPLTVADLTSNMHGVVELAERLPPHLGPQWRVAAEFKPRFNIVLSTDELRLTMRYAFDGEHQVLFTVIGADGESMASTGMNLFMLPSQIAARLNSEVLPTYRRRMAKERDARERQELDQQARLGHAQAVADRLGADWHVVEGTYGPGVVRDRKHVRVHGEIRFSDNGRLHLHLHNITPELVEHVVAGIEAQMDLLEHRSPALGKRPKHLSMLLHLMVAAGYRIDTLEREHERLFGAPLFKLGMHTVPGMPLVPFLLERPSAIDRALEILKKDNHATG